MIVSREIQREVRLRPRPGDLVVDPVNHQDHRPAGTDVERGRGRSEDKAERLREIESRRSDIDEEETRPDEPSGLARDLLRSAEDAAARRATRRLPLGEPPLVVTTHAITSFSIRTFPVPRESSLERERALSRRATSHDPSRPACESRPTVITIAPAAAPINPSPRRLFRIFPAEGRDLGQQGPATRRPAPASRGSPDRRRRRSSAR